MRAVNHALTGAFIGLAVANPVAAIPTAFLSHFFCDIIPHHGLNKPNQTKKELRSKIFKYFLLLDCLLCITLVVILFVIRPSHWQDASLCAFLATSPDLLWLDKFIKANQNKSWSTNWIKRLLSRIQWFERPIGAVVEFVWLIAGGFLLSLYLR